jgi:hypothetical protein
MGAPLTDAEFADQLRSFNREAFRLELQPAYSEPDEHDTVARFLAGHAQAPTEVLGLRAWFELVAELTGQGRRFQRVRVHDDPLTDYQRWERWIGAWNVAAGEQIHYLTRRRAHEIGLLPAAGNLDWWLLDFQRLIVMHFDDKGHRVRTELTTNSKIVAQACAWRDLAVHAASGKAPDAVA